MIDFAKRTEQLFDAYNSKNFDAMRAMIVPDLDFKHHNRGFVFNREELLASLPAMAFTLAPDRRFGPPTRVNVCGNTVYRETVYTATALGDIPGFAKTGEKLALTLCSILRFNDAGMLVEWKDFG